MTRKWFSFFLSTSGWANSDTLDVLPNFPTVHHYLFILLLVPMCNFAPKRPLETPTHSTRALINYWIGSWLSLILCCIRGGEEGSKPEAFSFQMFCYGSPLAFKSSKVFLWEVDKWLTKVTQEYGLTFSIYSFFKIKKV